MSEPVVIITRAQPGADATAKRVRDLGLRAVVSPALSLERVDSVPDLQLEASAGILFTSANSVRFFEEVSDRRDLIAWCVGPSTSAAAEEAGFSEIRNADGNSLDLAALVEKHGDRAQGHLVHIANTAAGDILQTELASAGFDVRFVGLYSPVESKSLANEVHDWLRGENSICVLIHSAKGAASFAKLLAPFQGIQITFICVSDKAAEPVSHLGSIEVAERPNEDALLQKLQDWQCGPLIPVSAGIHRKQT